FLEPVSQFGVVHLHGPEFLQGHDMLGYSDARSDRHLSGTLREGLLRLGRQQVVDELFAGLGVRATRDQYGAVGDNKGADAVRIGVDDADWLAVLASLVVVVGIGQADGILARRHAA